MVHHVSSRGNVEREWNYSVSLCKELAHIGKENSCQPRGHGLPQRASGNADFLPGKSQLLHLGLASRPRANSFCGDAGGAGRQQAGHGNTHQTLTEKACFGALFILTLLLLLLFHSFYTVTSSLRLISHTSKQSPAPNELSFSSFVVFMRLKTFKFPASVGPARNFLWLFF